MDELTDKKTIQERLMEIKNLIPTDLDRSKAILQSVIEDNKNDFYIMEINYVTNMIKEEELLQELTTDKKRQYHCLKILGNDFYHLGDYERAFFHYKLAKDITEHPIFDYYLGKMLYKQRKYQEALSYFQEYFSHGGEKLEKCLLYMFYIYKGQELHKKANKLLLRLDKIEKTFKSGFHIKNTNKPSNNRKEDFVKKKTTKNLKLNLNEFIEESNLEVESYHNYTFHQKLLVIRDLMIQNQVKKAESYLRKLTPETENDQQELVQFQKNKRIYRNRGK